MIDVSRRSLITGLVSLVAAPAVVRASSLMPVRAIREPILTWEEWEQRAFTRGPQWSPYCWMYPSYVPRPEWLSIFDDVPGGAQIGCQLRIRFPSAYAIAA